jgi:hypothetical protein
MRASGCGRWCMAQAREAHERQLRQHASEPSDTAAAFEEGLATLAQAPLSTPQIRAMLAQGGEAWEQLRAAVPSAAQPAGRMKVAAASEELLEAFDRLTEACQHSLQVLLG